MPIPHLYRMECRSRAGLPSLLMLVVLNYCKLLPPLTDKAKMVVVCGDVCLSCGNELKVTER